MRKRMLGGFAAAAAAAGGLAKAVADKVKATIEK